MSKQFRTHSKILSILLVLTLVLGSVSMGYAADTDVADTNAAVTKSGDIVVLYTNDVHCYVDDNIGYAGLAAYKADKLAVTDYVTLLDAGDAIQGKPIGTLSDGEYITDIMNFVGYDVAVPGNHEFDYGMKEFLSLADKAKFDYVCCNFMDLKTNKTVFDPYKIISYGDTQVAYIGIDTPRTFTSSTPTYFQDSNGKYIYDFCNDTTGEKLYTAVQSAIDAATAAGADYVVGVGHLGVGTDCTPWTSKEVIAKVSGLDVMIDAHSHSTISGEAVKDKAGEDVILTSTGTQLESIGEMVISDGKITTGLVTDYTKKDANTETYVKGIQAKFADVLAKVVAKSDVDLTIYEADGTTRAVRNQETNLGDLCADAYRAMMGTDIAFVNGGGVRANIEKGDITYEEIIAVHPFSNSACSVEATGQEILDALEMGARALPDENGGFLQVSGLTYTVDPNVASSVVVDDKGFFVKVGGDYRVKDVKIGGEALNLTKTYTLASHNYMLKSGGDGMNMFMDNKILKDEAMLDNEVLINYITQTLGGAVGSQYAAAQGRITVLAVDDVIPFTDLKGYGWAQEAIEYVYTDGLFKGATETTFEPATAMTRGMFVTVLGRMAEADVKAYTTSSFTDVNMGAYYGGYIEWAVANGIAKGIGDDKFNPNASITREQMASMVASFMKAEGYNVVPAATELKFTDAESVSSWAQQGALYCSEKGFISGYSTGNYEPAKTASRAEVAVVMERIDKFADANKPDASATTPAAVQPAA